MKMKEWQIGGIGLKTGDRLPDLKINASSFDEALEKARKKNKGYCSGQVINKEKGGENEN